VNGSERDDRVLETMVARLALGVARPLPIGLLQPAFDLMVATLRRRHPHAFARLEELADCTVTIDPVDLPLAFRLRLGGAGIRLALCRRDAEPSSAVIRGAFPALLDLLEGRTDGDALFFSRDLVIEGDTAVVVALRNAVDGEEIDLAADLAAALGPLGRLIDPARHVATRLAGGLADLHGQLLSPAHRRLEAVERRLARLEKRSH